MALGSANAILPTPAVDNTAKASAAATGSGEGSGTFADNLNSVLAQSKPAHPHTKRAHGHSKHTEATALAQTKLAKLKSKLKSGDTGAGTPGRVHTLPIANPVSGRIESAGQSEGQATDAANAALAKTTQEKLVAKLAQTAKAPVLKTGQADGSTVPNAKIARTHSEKSASDKDATGDGTGDLASVQAMAAKIAAVAAITNTSDTAQIAAKGVATAEAAAKTAATAPPVTKIETAAMANATQAAMHTPTAQAKIEAQALPVQFDAKTADAQDGDENSKSGGEDRNHTHSDSARTAGDTPRQASAPVQAPDTQPSTPTPAQTSATSSTANLATGSAATTPTASTPIAATLQVSQQPQQSAPTDQSTFAALGVAIAAKSKDGETQFDINMHPAELGRVDVRISVGADGKAQAHLSAEHPQTLQLLQNDKATLAQNLRDAGLDVANSGLSFSLKGEQQSSTPTFNARSRALSIAAIQTADVSSISSHASLAPGDSRLDIRV